MSGTDHGRPRRTTAALTGADVGCMWSVVALVMALSVIAIVVGITIGLSGSSWTLAIWGTACLIGGLLLAAVGDVGEAQKYRSRGPLPEPGAERAWPLPRHPSSDLMIFRARGTPTQVLTLASNALRGANRLAADEIAVLAVPKYDLPGTRRLVVKVMQQSEDSTLIALYTPDDSPRGGMDWLLNTRTPLFEEGDLIASLVNLWQELEPDGPLLHWADPAYGRVDLAEAIEAGVGGHRALWRERRPEILSRLSMTEQVVAAYECSYQAGKGLLLMTTDRLVYVPFTPPDDPGFAGSYAQMTALELKATLGGLYGKLRVTIEGRTYELTQFEGKPFGGPEMVEEARRRAGLSTAAPFAGPPWMRTSTTELQGFVPEQREPAPEESAEPAGSDTGAAEPPAAD